MENYKIKVQVLDIHDEIVGEFELNSREYEKIKNETGRDIIGQGVELVLNDLKEERHSKSHHYTNRVD